MWMESDESFLEKDHYSTDVQGPTPGKSRHNLRLIQATY